ncbi:MAG TPA: DUF4159 domain-containing protein [Gemmatimonadaceae bacterium]|nr:DUF4159 domain-containing protein [Gemmatimonadaceae bacterium]
MRVHTRILLIALLMIVVAPRATPQYEMPKGNVPYDGRFQLIRLEYTSGYVGWLFDYAWMEEHLMTMFDELTSVRIARKGSNILRMDDPELMKWPVAYLSEPGYWYVNTREAAGLRNYLKKGGFLIVDDFYEGSRQPEWQTFDMSIHRVLPDAKIFPLELSNPIFDSFFRIKTIKDIPYPGNGYQWIKAQFYGIYEDNDPKKRLMVVINYDTDLGDYMEWSGSGLWPVNLSNDAYKFAMNYIFYGLAF